VDVFPPLFPARLPSQRDFLTPVGTDDQDRQVFDLSAYMEKQLD
jgi:hypothetical protein